MADWTDELRDIVREPRIWYVATTSADGSPHVSPMWVDLDGDLVLFNTTIGRVKERNLRRDPRVCLSSVDQADPFDRVQIHGRAVRFVTGEQANRRMDALAGKYLGADRYEWLIPGEQRVTVFVEPTRIRRIAGVEPLPAAALDPGGA
ncbi:PPOX class F420-dependent enzyme [Actinosynnema sp. ALI-1.44]|uniref:PPOX class F420-dependent oxidoreductase n=1 Tax=Actinosynnema sp. ALI-1.44 TaxID=1933779 RepID=UPI00097BAFF9|nr:PPOX class F420-dependent oxidoreductase [Actinosynnema sp. ALI-1.44]ONI84206.1 PPOX class F420-dependent enzyme [Actinosynnema sp. ALI-1.44]